MQLEQKHIDALDEAETLMFHSELCPYLELKDLLPDPAPLARRRFRLLFTNYYGLNVGGLTDAFKVAFRNLVRQQRDSKRQPGFLHDSERPVFDSASKGRLRHAVLLRVEAGRDAYRSCAIS